jgi:hypothetical protein
MVGRLVRSNVPQVAWTTIEHLIADMLIHISECDAGGMDQCRAHCS